MWVFGGEETQFATVWIVQKRQDPATGDEVHAGVRLAEVGQVSRECAYGLLVRHTDDKGIEPGGHGGAFGIEAQAQLRPTSGVAQPHCCVRAAVNELDERPVAKARPVPLDGSGHIGHRKREAVDPGQCW